MTDLKENIDRLFKLDSIDRFQCTRCGECCSGSRVQVDIDYSDIKRWQREGRKDIISAIEPARHLDHEGKEFFTFDVPVDSEGHCKFFDNESKDCTIHDTKPAFCQLFPFTIRDNSMCPGIGQGKKLKVKPIRSLAKGHFRALKSFQKEGIKHEAIQISLASKNEPDDPDIVRGKIENKKPDFSAEAELDGYRGRILSFLLTIKKPYDNEEIFKDVLEGSLKEMIDLEKKEHGILLNTTILRHSFKEIGVAFILSTKNKGFFHDMADPSAMIDICLAGNTDENYRKRFKIGISNSFVDLSDYEG